ncbi:hypothetical protein EV424DRAFT_1304824, partial [Suillus variegatus]
IQRPLKLAIKELQHEDIVAETLTQLTAGRTADEIRLDVTKGTLRDRSVRWVVEAYKLINKPDIVQKAFSLCKAGTTPFNLSFESLASVEARRVLRDLPQTDPEMWQSIQPRQKQADDGAEGDADTNLD